MWQWASWAGSVSSRRAAEEEARPGLLLLPTDPQNQHKVQKTSSLWFDFSPFCLWWTSRQSVFVFPSWARVGGSFERSGSRTGDLCSPTPFPERVPSSPYTSPTTWNSKQRLWTGGGDKSQPTGKTSFANLQISCICLWSGRESAEGNCWEGAAQQWRSTAQIAPSDPHPYMDFCRENFRHGDNSLTKQKQRKWVVLQLFNCEGRCVSFALGVLGST